MRLSEWRAAAPHRDAATPKVAAVVDPVLRALGAEADPHCWVAWGEEPANRYTIFVATEPGLIATFVRVNVAGEGPRATTKLIRWSRVTIGEMAIETQGGHRLLSFQLEGQVLRGVDEEADRVAAFGLRVIAAIDGRPLPPFEDASSRGRSASSKPAAAGAKPGKSGGASTAATIASKAAPAGSVPPSRALARSSASRPGSR